MKTEGTEKPTNKMLKGDAMEHTYWDRNGHYQAVGDILMKLIPSEGSVAEPKKNKALEKFRIASNCYYDLYNNGLCNRASEFYSIFKVSSRTYRRTYGYGRSFSGALYEKTEIAMDRIIEAAAVEQGIALLTVETL